MATPALSQSDVGIVREESNEVSQITGAAPSRQMKLLFDKNRLDELAATERNKIISVLARILMQAAGLRVEELEDDQR
ncbi:hypothetical protein [Bradyrhizobium sp. 18]|uniref:hypothetical protein n=1 Tax=Bradyrhizobium sp. 18 TaxID=2782657 RepID=UPI001FFB86AA|nr:hypothetical protein [Bradyrhizobium sp. 18]MCK1510854.1 hypothetical protein [Bradyrhizobium sp. 18]